MVSENSINPRKIICFVGIKTDLSRSIVRPNESIRAALVSMFCLQSSNVDPCKQLSMYAVLIKPLALKVANTGFIIFVKTFGEVTSPIIKVLNSYVCLQKRIKKKHLSDIFNGIE